MAEKEEVVAAVRATLLSCQGALSLAECDRDFKQMQGYCIPYKKLGFQTLNELFESVPGFRISDGSNGQRMITVIPSSETKHIATMIARQKSSKKPMNRMPPRRLNQAPRNYNSNMSFYPGYNKTHYTANRYSKDVSFEPRTNQYPHRPADNQKGSEFIMKNNKAEPRVRSPKSETISKSQKPDATTKNPSKIIKTPPKNETNSKPQATERTVQNQNGKPLKVVVNPTTMNTPNPIYVSKAASRLKNLQAKIREETVVEKNLVQVKIDNLNSELSKLTVDDNFKENKSRLIKYCELKKIPPPEFKTHEIPRKGRSRASYDCTVKIQNVVFNTYPNSESTLELAIEKACSEALKHFNKKENEKPLTSKDVAIQRLLEIISSCSSGFITKKLPEVYLNKYEEKLPDDWLDLVQASHNFKIENVANGLTILLLNNNDNGDDIIEISSSSSTSSITELFTPPLLEYPSDLQWNVFVMSANSPIEVWIRIIGEEYSGAFETLNTDMELHYIDEKKPAHQISIDVWYALKCEDGWLRSRILDIDVRKQTALCFLPDTGDEENHPFTSFYDIPKKFLNLPPQAILCRLSGLEEYSEFGAGDILTEYLVGKVLIAEVCEIPYDTNNDDPSVTIVLYDTSTEHDINLNTTLLERLSQEGQPPQLPPGISEIHICDVQADGTIYAQIRNDKWNLLDRMIRNVISGSFLKDTLQSSFGSIDLTPNVRYLVKSSGGNWMRATLKHNTKGVSNKAVLATYIDYGYSEKVSIKDVIRLDRISSVLNSFPVQVLKLSLHNVPPLSNEHLEFLNKHIPADTAVLCRRVSPETNAVEIFVRILPANVLSNINDAIRMEIELAKTNQKDTSNVGLNDKLEIFPNSQFTNHKNIFDSKYMSLNGLPSAILPEKKSQFEIFVLMAANPSNFMVQSWTYRDAFNELMLRIQSQKMTPIRTEPIIGCVYLASHEKDGIWHRVILQSIMTHNMASVYFCDYGHLQMIETNKLRELPGNLKEIPPQAIRAKLFGVSPINADWLVEDCMRFKEIVVNRKFKSIVEKIEQDPLQKNEPLLTLNLLDSCNNSMCVSDVLLKESRARRSM